MNLLLINSVSSSPFCAYFDGQDLSVETVPQTDVKPQDKLINSLYSLSGKSHFQKINAISVITGPGSFTGIRVGLAIAKGVSIALNKKIIPITSFEISLNRIRGQDPSKKYCVLVPAKPSEYYYAIMQEGKELSRGFISISGVDSVLKPGLILVAENIEDAKPEPDSMLELSIKYFKEGKLLQPEQIEPLYIKDFIVKKIN